MDNTPKLQHYVPQFYLKTFATKISSKEFWVTCFDKSENKKFLVNIKGICAEKHFYDSDDDLPIDKILTKLEDEFNITYKKLLKSADLNALTVDDKISLGYFIATQWLRTKERREMSRDTIKQMTERLSKEKLSPEFEAKLKDANTEQSLKSLHLNFLKDLPRYVSIILGMKWILFVNKTTLPYWTSDHPVCMFNSLDLWPYGNLGLKSKGIEMHFPLSPILKLGICDPIRFNKFPANFNVTDKQNIIFANSLQVNGSARHIFSITDDFSLAEKMIRENPTLRNLDRKQVSIN